MDNDLYPFRYGDDPEWEDWVRRNELDFNDSRKSPKDRLTARQRELQSDLYAEMAEDESWKNPKVR